MPAIRLRTIDYSQATCSYRCALNCAKLGPLPCKFQSFHDPAGLHLFWNFWCRCSPFWTIRPHVRPTPNPIQHTAVYVLAEVNRRPKLQCGRTFLHTTLRKQFCFTERIIG